LIPLTIYVRPPITGESSASLRKVRLAFYHSQANLTHLKLTAGLLPQPPHLTTTASPLRFLTWVHLQLHKHLSHHWPVHTKNRAEYEGSTKHHQYPAQVKCMFKTGSGYHFLFDFFIFCPQSPCSGVAPSLPFYAITQTHKVSWIISPNAHFQLALPLSHPGTQKVIVVANQEICTKGFAKGNTQCHQGPNMATCHLPTPPSTAQRPHQVVVHQWTPLICPVGKSVVHTGKFC